GQGLCTALAQICASELGIRPEDVTVMPGDTSGVSLGLGAFASRQTVTAGNSVLLAARAVADKAKKLASHVLEAAEHDLEIADGQVHGGIAHGIGNALFEWMGYDDSGQPLTTTFADYLLPTATELPTFMTLYRQTPSPLNPLGVKGVGEVGTIPAAAAIISA